MTRNLEWKKINSKQNEERLWWRKKKGYEESTRDGYLKNWTNEEEFKRTRVGLKRGAWRTIHETTHAFNT